MSLCFAPFYYWWLCYVLLIPLLIACQHSNPETRMLRGALFGITYFGIGSYWLTKTLVTQVDFSWPMALFSNFLIAGACALAPTVFCWLAGYANKIKILVPILLSALWVFTEDIRFQVFGGGPWISLGQSQLESPIAGFYPLIGEVGSSGVVILISFCILSVLKNEVKAKVHSVRIVMPLIMILLLGFGQWSKQQQWTTKSADKITLAMVQSATSQQHKMQAIGEIQRLNELTNLSQEYLGKANLIIWPETVVTLEKHHVVNSLTALHNRAKNHNSTLLIGAFEATLDQHLFNTAFTIGSEPMQSYRKRHLVLFGEYVPSFLSFIDPYVPGDQHRSFGRTPELISINGQLLGISICWEGAFSRDMSTLVKLGATLLINVANEAWFADSSLPLQNLDAMRIRAIETGRPAVRVANMGPGAFIDEKGVVKLTLPAKVASSAFGTLQPMTGMTPFVALGADFILLISSLLCLGIGLLNYIAYKNENND